MANTYTQLHIHIVLCCTRKKNLLSPDYRVDVEKYITGIVQKRNINYWPSIAMPDHIHLFVGLHPTDSILI